VRRVHLAVTLAAATLALGGCTAQPSSSSAGDFKGEEADVAQVVDDISSAGQKGNADDICAKYVSKELAASLKAGDADCTDELQEAIQDVNDFELKVKDVTISGDTAKAEIEQGDDKPSTATFELARDGKSWRVTSFGA
jgi:hypothetical protein